MSARYMIVGLTHFLGVALALSLLNFVLPCCVSCSYTCVANFVLSMIMARLTFGISKKRFLTNKIHSDNRAVFITGCDSGFGHDLAKRLDSKGYHVFASCLFPSGSGADDLKKSCSKRLQVLELDVRKDESVEAALQFVKENLGTSELWAVVNNAGILKGYAVELTSLEEFKECFEVNTFGVVRVTKAFLPLLRQTKGRVINLASLAGRLPVANCTPYCMSKFATVAFSECLRQEMHVWGVRVISVEPEFFQTNIISVDNITNTIETTFAAIDEDIKADYGEKYLQSFKQNYAFTMNAISSPKIYKVLNALEMAISLEDPDAVYTPCRNIAFRVIYKFLAIAPAVVFDFIVVTVCGYLTGFPKPKEAGNSS